MIWKTCSIEPYLDEIKILFLKNADHKHADNYLKEPLFEYTKFARLGWDRKLVYYSAGVERPEYNGSIRIMTRHTRDRNYNFGSLKDDLNRGVETLDLLAHKSLEEGYTNIWMSREESPKMLEYFCKHSRYNWKITFEQMPHNTRIQQYVIRMQNTNGS